MATPVQTATIRTQVPSRLDRLPWSKFHWKVVIGLGTVWILDGLEVTMVSSVAARITEDDSGLNLTLGQVGIAGAIYVLGACLGALLFGHLTDRFGRKKLFMLTLVVYLVATVATAFSFAPWYFFLARFVTGAGIGGEYAAINSAIDELIPARARGRVDLTINGSYWLGAAGGAAAALFFLAPGIFADWLGWRLAFGVGAVLGLVILLVRRNVPESPRWLFIHGRAEEAERLVDGIERDVRSETGQELAEPDSSITVRQRTTISFSEIAKTAFKLYPKRAVLGLALFVGQAFIYNGITFNLGTLFSTFFGVAGSFVPIFIIIWSLSNFLGPVLLGRLFDTVGRIPMIAGTYLGSAILTVPMAILFVSGTLGAWTFLVLILGVFFLASAGASAAYLTVSEVFPMETRALAIAFFYAVGTAVGGITGPLLFGKLIGTEEHVPVMIAFLIGAAVMALGGIAELFLGVRSERASLEDIAKPLTATEAEEPGPAAADSDRMREARQCRESAEQERARAAEHRAASLEAHGDEQGQREEDALADMAELRARALEEQATAHELLAEAADGGPEHARAALLARAQAAEQRARGWTEREHATDAEDDAEGERHGNLAEAANERAREREQWALAEQARDHGHDGDQEVGLANAAKHEQWAEMHSARATAADSRAAGDNQARRAADADAEEKERLALAAEQRVVAAEHRAGAQAVRGEITESDAERARQEEGRRRAEESEQRIRERIRRREHQARRGIRRFAPGPGSLVPGGRSGGLDPAQAATVEQVLDQEVDVIARALGEHGPTDRAELADLVGARYWGPGRFGQALDAAVSEGRARRLSARSYGPPQG